MKQAAAQSDALEQAGKEAYSGNVIDMVNNPKHYNQSGIECIDGRVGDELEDSIQEYFYDIEGADIRHIKTITE